MSVNTKRAIFFSVLTTFALALLGRELYKVSQQSGRVGSETTSAVAPEPSPTATQP